MACTMNVVILHGRMATDPEMRFTKSGKPRTTFLIAIDRIGSDDADFIRIICWEKQAELTNDYLKKGREVIIQGQLRSYRDDQNKHQEQVVARHVTFVGKRDSGNGEQQSEPQAQHPQQKPADDFDPEDVPF